MKTTDDQLKKISFPRKRSIGSVYFAPLNQPEEWELLTQVRGLVVSPENEPIHWELLDEARGTILVPPGVKLKLKISADAEGLSVLEELEPNALHALDLGHTAVKDSALAHVASLSGLRFLELTSTSVGLEGISFLRTLKSLHSIGLSYSRATAEAIQYLGALIDLREIWLSGTKVDDTALEHLNNLHSLVQLGLSSTLVTDAGLIKLAKLKKLLRIYLFNTKVTHNGTRLLRSILPGCRVKWHPPKVHNRVAEDFVAFEDESTREEHDSDYPSSKFCEADFWHLVSLLDWQQQGNDEAVIAPVVEELSKLDTQDILQFAEILAHKLYLLDGEIFAKEIGSDAYTGNKGSFAKNWFLYARCCVIANGKDYYSLVLADPNQMPKETEFQALLTIAPKAYRLKTGKRLNYTSKYNYETFSNKQLWVSN